MCKWGRFIPGCAEVWLTKASSVHTVLFERLTIIILFSPSKVYTRHWKSKDVNLGGESFFFFKRSNLKRLFMLTAYDQNLRPTMVRLQQVSGIMVLFLGLALL